MNICLIVEYIIFQNKCNEERRSGKYNTLEEAAFEAVLNEDYNFLEELFKEGIDMEMTDKDGDTLLVTALLSFHLDVGSWLIRHGASVNCCDQIGKRPIDRITDAPFDYGKEIQLLFDNGAKLGGSSCDEKRTPLMNCVMMKNWRNLTKLLQLGADPNECSPVGSSPAELALEMGRIDCFEILLSFGADPNGPDFYSPVSMTGSFLSKCLRLLQGTVCDDVMLTLLGYGADMNQRDHNGSPFLMAIEYGNVFWANYFAQKGCSIVFYDRACGPTVCFGVTLFDYHQALDMTENELERDCLNKLLFGSGEKVVIDIDRLLKPHEIVKMIEFEKNQVCLKSLCRKAIRNHLLSCRCVNLIFQVQKLGLPEIVSNYLIYH